jgi:hypothetical protein
MNRVELGASVGNNDSVIGQPVKKSLLKLNKQSKSFLRSLFTADTVSGSYQDWSGNKVGGCKKSQIKPSFGQMDKLISKVNQEPVGDVLNDSQSENLKQIQNCVAQLKLQVCLSKLESKINDLRYSEDDHSQLTSKLTEIDKDINGLMQLNGKSK